jgi:hypothetical protein
MRAALINSFGEPTEVLELADVPEPSAPAAVGCSTATIVAVAPDWLVRPNLGLCLICSSTF